MTKPDIIETIQQEGFDPKQRGGAHWMPCCFHPDKTPSLRIDSARQLYHCFGCNEGGDVISFIQQLHHLSFVDALHYLKIDGRREVKTDPLKEKKQQLVRAFRQWEKGYRRWLICYLRAFDVLKLSFRSMDDVTQFLEIFNQMPLVEHQLDVLDNGTDSEKYELWKEVQMNGEL